jgi:hypothetical protein
MSGKWKTQGIKDCLIVNSPTGPSRGGSASPEWWVNITGIHSQVLPVITPGQDCMLVLGFPFLGKALQGMLSYILTGSGVYFFEIRAKRLAVLPYYV